MATTRMQQPAHHDLEHERSRSPSRLRTDGIGAPNPAAESSGASHNPLLHIAENEDENDTYRPLVATAIWDWEAPDLHDNDSSWYYEPQGELLTTEKDRNVAANEFTIPYPVPGSGVNWSSSNPLHGLNHSKGDSASWQKASGISPRAQGLKRKASFEKALLGPNPKRPSRGTPAEVSLAQQAPLEDQPPSLDPNIGNRVAGAHRASSTAPRPAARPSSPRRTLTDPSTPMILPARKVFPIQIGDKLFRLSGASISSDGKHLFGSYDRRID